ncbi:MAG: hypothetical protein MZU95_14650 [Desulfomicrobium escambiense]|nr:hypothetical protein [Desulfomicrobium escambiense]
MLSTNRRAIDLKTVALGPRPADRLRAPRPQERVGPARRSRRSATCITQAARLRERRVVVRLRAAGRQGGVAAHHDRRRSATRARATR